MKNNRMACCVTNTQDHHCSVTRVGCRGGLSAGSHSSFQSDSQKKKIFLNSTADLDVLLLHRLVVLLLPPLWYFRDGSADLSPFDNNSVTLFLSPQCVTIKPECATVAAQ